MFIAAALSLGVAPAAQADVGAELKALTSQGKFVDAYNLGKQNPDLLGDPDFDFHFGIASIDAGHASDGVLALERYLLTFPNNPQARLELARGYFVLGEDARAREEFGNVLALKPPQEVVANINRYLDAIRLREARYQTTARAYIEGGFGWDSNVNGGIASSSVTLPGLGVVQIGTSGQRQGDLARVYGAGAQITHPVAAGFSVFAGIDLDRKDLRNSGAFETENIAVNGGASWIVGNSLLRAVATQSTFSFGHSRFRSVTGVAGEWQHQLTERDSLNAGVQVAQIRYPGINEPRDTDLVGLSVGYRRTLAGAWQPVLSAGLSIADDDTRRDRPDFSRSLQSLRLGLTAAPMEKLGLSVGLSLQESRYRAEQNIPALGISLPKRQDRYAGLDFGATYLIDRALSIKAEASIAENGSNIDLYTYRRSALTVKLRYEFK